MITHLLFNPGFSNFEYRIQSKMKKLFLIAIVMLFSYVKGYSQLMQSNSISGSGQRSLKDTIHYLNKVQSLPDSIIKIPSLQSDKNLSKAMSNMEAIKNELKQQVEILNAVKTANKRSGNYKRQTANLNNSIDSLKKELKDAQTEIDNYRKGQFGLKDQINNLLTEKYELFLNSLGEELKKYKLEIDNNTKSALKSFDTVIHASNVHTQHFIDSLSNHMNMKSYIMERKLNDLVHQKDILNNYFIELKKQQTDLIEYKDVSNLKDIIYSKIDSTSVKLKKQHEKVIAEKKPFVDDYNKYVDTVNSYIAKINSIAKKASKEDEESPTKENLSALAGVNKIFGDNGALIPNISIVAQKKFKSDANASFYGEVKILAGGSSDDKTNNGLKNLFVPEASTYGFITNFTFGFIGAHQAAKKDALTGRYQHKLGINVGAYYLGKKLQPDTLTRFNTNVFHLKLGIQYILIPNVLSAYVNTNYMVAATNISEFEKYYTDVKKVKSFTSFGIESYLDLNDVKDFHLLINLGFVNINNDIRSWIKTSDAVIPNVKLSLVKTFDF